MENINEINYEDSAVAFIDLLGFKHLVINSTNGHHHLRTLQNIVNVMESAVPSLNTTADSSVPQLAIPKYTYISDSIILSAPLNVVSDYKNYDGLASVIMRCIQLSQLLLKEGYLTRGGIAIGKVWHSQRGNIVGPAYIVHIN